MKVAIHQPNYLPWFGYFYKMAIADVFIVLDTAQFTKNSYQNRVKIKSSAGPIWLTQPVRLADGAFKPTENICFADSHWKQKHIKTLQANYAKSNYFKIYSTQLFDLLLSDENNLSQYNIRLIEWAAKVLKIDTPVLFASTCPSVLSGTERLIELIGWAHGDTYISGKGGQNYQNAEAFRKAGIDLIIVDYPQFAYPQPWGDFIQGLSIVDLIFNYGDEGTVFFKRTFSTY